MMESGAGNKIKLWVRAVRVLAGFIIEQNPVGPMLRWGCDTMRLHEIAMRENKYRRRQALTDLTLLLEAIP